jgi:hypothetical protein
MTTFTSGLIVVVVIGVIFIIPVAAFAYIAMSIEQWLQNKDNKWDE